MRFWDASAIAPLLMTEATTRPIQTLAAKDAAMLERLDGFDILTTLRTAHRFTNDIAAVIRVDGDRSGRTDSTLFFEAAWKQTRTRSNRSATA